MVEFDIAVSADAALEECRRRGLVVASERPLAGRSGSRHWHLRMADRPGTLELSKDGDRVWVKVHPRRAGEWAPDVARELAALRPG